MAKIPSTLKPSIIICASILVLLAIDEVIPQNVPDAVLGTYDAEYRLFTPTQIVDAGGGGGAGTLSNDLPQDLGTAAPGTSTEASRDDHVHKRPTEIAENSAAIIINRAAIAEKPALSDAEPQFVESASRSGSGTKASRDDHEHAFNGYGSDIRPVGNAISEGVLDAVARVDHVHTYSGGSGGGGGASTFIELTDTPSAYTSNEGKIVSVNDDADALIFIDAAPDLSERLDDAQDDIENLNFLTQDLIAGRRPDPSTGWRTQTDPTKSAIALFDIFPSCTAAKGGTYSVRITSGVSGKYHAIRLPNDTTDADLAQNALLIKGNNISYREVLTGHGVLYERNSICSDSDYTYYAEGSPNRGAFGSAVTGVLMQTTTQDAHVGTSRYQGDPTKVERWGIIGDSTNIPVSKTMPSLTGNAGKVLSVNSGEKVVEWIDVSSEESGGKFEWTKIVSISVEDGSRGNQVAIAHNEKCGSEYQFYMITNNTGPNTPLHSLYGIGLNTGVNAVGFSFPDPYGSEYLSSFDENCKFDNNGTLQDLYSVSIASDVPIHGPDGFDIWGSPGFKSSSSGGSSGPVIPDPSTTGALDYLRVNSSGNAYELADFPLIPQGSGDLPEPTSSQGFQGTSNKWSPSDHSHPVAGNDEIIFEAQAATNFSAGGAAGGIECGDTNAPTQADCKNIRDNIVNGTYKFVIVRVARYDDNSSSEPIHISGCALYPGIPGTILDGNVNWSAACTANSGKNSANTFNQYDIMLNVGQVEPWFQLRLPNYNSYGVTNITVAIIGIR